GGARQREADAGRTIAVVAIGVYAAALAELALAAGAAAVDVGLVTVVNEIVTLRIQVPDATDERGAGSAECDQERSTPHCTASITSPLSSDRTTGSASSPSRACSSNRPPCAGGARGGRRAPRGAGCPGA